MLTHDYSYAAGLEGSVTHAWTVEDCFQGRDFDFSKPFLPDRIAGVRDIACLGDREKLQLNQIRANAYCHLFAFVEEFIVPHGARERDPRRVRRRDAPLVAVALRGGRSEASGDDAASRRAVRERVRCALRPRRRTRSHRRGGAEDLAARGAAAHEPDRVVRPAPLRRSRPRRAGPRPVVPRHPAVPLDRRVPPRTARLAAHRRGRERPSGRDAGTGCRRAARARGCGRRTTGATARPRHRGPRTQYRTGPHRRTTRTRSVRPSSVRTGGRSSCRASNTRSSPRSSSELTADGRDKVASAALALSV